MTLNVRKARRSEAKPLVGLYAESGKGKTMSALLLARGFVGPEGKIIMAETESGRGEVFVDHIEGGYDVIPIRDGFAPTTMIEAVVLAEKEGAHALIIDSASHEWEGPGGVLDMADKNKADGKKGMLVWQKPKMDHEKFIRKLMNTSIPLVVLCMRAKYPMEEQMVKGKKEWVRSQNLAPKQSDAILYEMMIHGWIDAEHRFMGTKYTVPELEQVLPTGERISTESGHRLATWASEVAAKKTGTDENIVSILRAIESAKTMDELKRVSEPASRLSAEEKKQAKEAYKKAASALGQRSTGGRDDGRARM